MDIEDYSQNGRGKEKIGQLSQLVQQAKDWQRLDSALKEAVLATLHPYFKVSCIQQHTLFISANSAMAASRLKMLSPALLARAQTLGYSVNEIKIKVSPVQAAIGFHAEETPIFLQLDTSSINVFEATAKRFCAESKLAKSLMTFVHHQRNCK